MTFNITDVSTSCCRSKIASGENDMRPALADRKSLIPFAAAGVRSATISVCFSTTVTGGLLVLLEIEFRSCPADPFAAGSGRWSCGFIDCFLKCSAVLANSFARASRLVLCLGSTCPRLCACARVLPLSGAHYILIFLVGWFAMHAQRQRMLSRPTRPGGRSSLRRRRAQTLPPMQPPRRINDRKALGIYWAYVRRRVRPLAARPQVGQTLAWRVRRCRRRHRRRLRALYCRQSAVDGGEAHGRFVDQVVGVPDRGWRNLRFPATRHGVSQCVATIHFSAAAVRSAGYSTPARQFSSMEPSSQGVPQSVACQPWMR